MRLAVTPSPWHACTPLPCQSPEKKRSKPFAPWSRHVRIFPIARRSSVSGSLGERATELPAVLLPICKEKKKTCSTHDLNPYSLNNDGTGVVETDCCPCQCHGSYRGCGVCLVHTAHAREISLSLLFHGSDTVKAKRARGRATLQQQQPAAVAVARSRSTVARQAAPRRTYSVSISPSATALSSVCHGMGGRAQRAKAFRTRARMLPAPFASAAGRVLCHE